MTRPAAERLYASVTEAIYCVARFTPGLNLTKVAARMEWSEDQLSDRTSGRQRFDAEWMIALTLATGNHAAVRTLCRLVGMVAVPIPKPGCKPADVLAGMSEVSREYSEAMKACVECLDGGTPQEKLDAVQQLTDLIESASAAREHLQPKASA